MITITAIEEHKCDEHKIYIRPMWGEDVLVWCPQCGHTTKAQSPKSAVMLGSQIVPEGLAWCARCGAIFDGTRWVPPLDKIHVHMPAKEEGT